jgi:hypothetical protein
MPAPTITMCMNCSINKVNARPLKLRYFSIDLSRDAVYGTLSVEPHRKISSMRQQTIYAGKGFSPTDRIHQLHSRSS